MLNNTLERLRAMKMSAFADELECQIEDAENYNQLGFEDRLSLLVDCEWNRRQNNKLLRYIRNAHFSDSAATMEGIEYIEDRHLDKGKMPRSFFTEQALENLRRIVSNKAALIKHALNTDNLEIIESDIKSSSRGSRRPRMATAQRICNLSRCCASLRRCGSVWSRKLHLLITEEQMEVITTRSTPSVASCCDSA